ncbi:hypothetical protein, partial [Enterocloster sp.]|uniref:hypothetical protein n=1 Tax=Enterocloster sp. TaxID=2719315 RepID=UPI00284CD01D
HYNSTAVKKSVHKLSKNGKKFLYKMMMVSGLRTGRGRKYDQISGALRGCLPHTGLSGRAGGVFARGFSNFIWRFFKKYGIIS